MGTRQGTNKLPSHVALHDHHHHNHNSISDFSIDSISLSFAGLVSVQDQQQQSQIPNNQDEHYDHKLTKLPEPPFEFATTNKSDSDSNSASNPINRITPADVLISNGKIVPQALPSSQLPPNRSFISNNIPQRSLRTFLAGDHHHHHTSSKMMPSGKKTGKKADRKYYEPLSKERNEEIKNEKAEARTGFGQRVLKSFLAPCRKCKAIQPGAVKCSREKSSKYR